MAILKRIPRASSVDDRLQREHAADVTSQHGEDGILAAVFELIGVERAYCVDVGAWDGRHWSNTYNLIVHGDWQGTLIEANDKRVAELDRDYPARERITICHARVGWSGPAALDAVLESTPAPQDFDLLSIDIDGNDWHVWHGLERYRPRVVVVEFNPTMPNDCVFIQDGDPRINQGCSLRALVELGREKGYELASTTMCNAVFVAAELFPALGIDDNDIDRIHEIGPWASHLVFLYDGTLLIHGNARMPWHDVQIDAVDLQVLPSSLRRFPEQLA